MQTKNRIRGLEDRIARIEAAISANWPDARADRQFQAWLDKIEAGATASRNEEMSALSDMRTQLNRQLAFQGDRLASLALKLDMTHSRVERMDRIQDQIRQAQEEQETTLAEIADRLECRSPSLQSATITTPEAEPVADRHPASLS